MRGEKRRPQTAPHQLPAKVATTHSTAATAIDAVDTAGVVDGCLVVRVDGDRYPRRVYLSLAPAERAVARAKARGHDAELLLCELVPVSVVPAATLDGVA